MYEHSTPESRRRRVPRPFTMHWGSGSIVEEAAVAGPHHNPALQLMEFTEGEGAGSLSVRFCYYSNDGRFQRSPLMLDEDGIAAMREALKATPRLRALLRQLVQE